LIKANERAKIVARKIIFIRFRDNRIRRAHVKITLNKIRLESGLNKLKLEENLSRKAQQIGSALVARQSPPLLFTDQPLRNMTLCYYTQDLELIPENLKAKIMSPGLKNAGLHLFFVKTAEFARGAYLVTIILE